MPYAEGLDRIGADTPPCDPDSRSARGAVCVLEVYPTTRSPSKTVEQSSGIKTGESEIKAGTIFRYQHLDTNDLAVSRRRIRTFGRIPWKIEKDYRLHERYLQG